MKSRRATVALTLAGALAVAGCGSSASSSGSSGTTAGRSGTLSVGMGEPATTMNPVLLAPAIYGYFNYDPLIYQTASGQFIPDLASSWACATAALTRVPPSRSRAATSRGSASTASVLGT